MQPTLKILFFTFACSSGTLDSLNMLILYTFGDLRSGSTVSTNLDFSCR